MAPAGDEDESGRVAVTGRRDRVVEVLTPPGTAQPPPGNAAKCQRDSQRRSHTEARPLDGVAVGQVDDGLRPPRELAERARIEPVEEGYERQAHGQIRVTD